MELHKRYHEEGLSILAFPCNQFGKQEPGSEEEIQQFAEALGVKFPIFDKIEVNGQNVDALFDFLKKKLPGIFWTTSVKWNFTKFLVDKHGTPIKRYGPSTQPLRITKDIEKLLLLQDM